MSSTNYEFATQLIHAAQEPDLQTGAVNVPIHLSSTFAQKSPGQPGPFEYSRSDNPTRQVLQKNLAVLEKGSHAFCFSSGCAATTAVIMMLKSGDHVVCGSDLYGGTHRLFGQIFSRLGITTTPCDLYDANNLAPAIQKNTRMIWLETPSNPMLKLADIEAISKVANDHKLILVVDNTFASPYLQNPLTLGAHVVVHSTTKYIGGHSDILGGAAITNDESLAEQIGFLQNACGGVPSPFECYLALRSLKTLHVRMQRHCENATQIADLLSSHPKIKRVIFPGHKSFTQNELYKKQMRGPGGMISLEITGTAHNAAKFLENLSVFTCAESLGGVESLAESPFLMTHQKVDDRLKKILGISPELIRLSVGIEDIKDLKNDILHALEQSFS